MLSTLYSALTGMLGFSKGLDVISNNVANLNTPGFKSSELAFRDLFYRYTGDGAAQGQLGYGLDTKGTRMHFRQGELRESGNPLDVAIDGNGFLVLRADGGAAGAGLFYTRAGQLQFGADGLLVERVSGARVMALQGGALREVSLDGLRTSAPQATSQIRLTGNLSTGSTTADLANVTVFDQAGRSHTLSLRFTRDAADAAHWFVEARDADNLLLGTGQVRFQGNGSPAAGASTMSFAFAPPDAPSTTITVDLGEPGSFAGVTNFSGPAQSELQVRSQNGVAAGALTEVTFDETGTLRLSYSNGRSASGPRLALAWFENLQALRIADNGLFADDSGQAPIMGGAREGTMGRMLAGRVELSNVELTEQFTDLIILQRGYQASSQVTSVANEMIQQLLDVGRKR